MEINLLTAEAKIGRSGFCFHVPDRAAANDLIEAEFNSLAKIAYTGGFEFTQVRHPKARYPVKIYAHQYKEEEFSLATMASTEQDQKDQKKVRQQLDLVGADYLRILEFLTEQRHEGNIVIITSNVTRDDRGQLISTDNPAAGRDICYHTNDLLLPTRAHWTANQFTGYNYRLSWRRDWEDYDRLNPEYDRLKEALERDGVAPNFEYTLFRPDGALCRYSTSYFRCQDYCGDEVRIGVSRPQDWEMLTPAPVS